MTKLTPPIFAIASFLVAITTAVGADWMWVAGQVQGENPEFRREFSLTETELAAGTFELRALGDFCHYKISINGKEVVRAEAFDPGTTTVAKRWLREGKNQISVQTEAVAGPSAIALELGDTDISSGDGWQGAVAISPMAKTLQLGAKDLASISPLDEYNQWKEAKAGAGGATFSPLPAGFKIEQLRAAKPDEGSWISMAFDPSDRGGLIISKEKRGLLRFDLEKKSMTVVEDTLLEIRGMLFAHGALYANANNSKALFRLHDTSDDGHFDQVGELIATAGGVGHGRNDLALGPDGLIHSIHGDSVKPPAGISRSRPEFGKTDRVQGHLIRFDADGKQIELMVTGLRNPYGIAFNRDGEAFTYDADNEGDIGLPLYRPARVNHLVSGANFGWQQAAGESWPVYSPESLPTTHDAGRGSPTSVEFGTRSNFPPRYRDALFILDWAYGRIIALDLIPHGASYRCRAHTFLRGRPLNVTDLTFGPDGAMYFITGGRGTQSALYRVSYQSEGEKTIAERPTPQEKRRAEFSRHAREQRRKLEAYHGARRDLAQLESIIWKRLESADPWIRHAALVALASHPQLLENSGHLASLLVSATDGKDSSQQAGQLDFNSLRRHEKLTVLRIFELGGFKDGDHLARLFPDGDPAVDRELSKLLAQTDDESLVPKALKKYSATGSQFERLHYLNVLSHAKAGWDSSSRQAFFKAIQHPDYFRGDRNMSGYLKKLRERALANMNEQQRAELGELARPATKIPPPKFTIREPVKHWKVADLLGEPPKDFRADAKRGEEIFKRASCVSCHQFGSIGTAVGPDLTMVANRFSRRDLIEAIVDPSKAMAEVFRNLVIKKKDGKTVVGRVVRDDFRKSTISVSINPFQPTQLTVISKHDIESHKPSPVSPMPAGLLDGFTREEIFQLLEFLEVTETGL